MRSQLQQPTFTLLPIGGGGGGTEVTAVPPIRPVTPHPRLASIPSPAHTPAPLPRDSTLLPTPLSPLSHVHSHPACDTVSHLRIPCRSVCTTSSLDRGDTHPLCARVRSRSVLGGRYTAVTCVPRLCVGVCAVQLRLCDCARCGAPLRPLAAPCRRTKRERVFARNLTGCARCVLLFLWLARCQSHQLGASDAQALVD